ncbi:MAG: esterase/lipase family protein [Candidatus Thorarchaeota archaeon]|jgi:pimeloyl-ACP methyl ester carboxylesterase
MNIIQELTAPTMGGPQLWADEFLYAGYCIQRNTVTKHYRLLNPSNVRQCFGTFEECLEVFNQIKERESLSWSNDELIILLHGIFRAKDAFGPMTQRLREEGWEAHSLNYPSTLQSLDEHAIGLEKLLNRLEGISKVHFVTHSMGGIVARTLLARESEWKGRIEVGRVVFIATPNKGARIADILQASNLAMLLGGPSLIELTTEKAKEIPVPDVNFGIVAGIKGDGQGYNPMLDGEDDMTVSVSEVILDGAEDQLLVRALHTIIQINPKVIDGTVSYLRTGRF